MPSARSSSAIRPSSPLSPRYEASRYDSLLQPPSPRAGFSSRGNSNPQRRTANPSLRLPTLPRFHPANFPSAHSSYQSTPEEQGTARAPLSPRTHQRMYSEAQKQLLMYHRDAMAASRALSPLREKPTSPRLVPLGSPGLPVTPLELEGEDEYFVAGLKSSTNGMQRKELVDNLIQKEVRQTTARKTSGTSPRTRS